MKHTMRSAYRRWMTLHNEEKRPGCRIRLPKWFCVYVRSHKDWKYLVTNEKSDIYCNRHELDYEARRRYKGRYLFEISDEELLLLERPEWIK